MHNILHVYVNSSPRKLHVWVLPGSNLGPLLYIIYVLLRRFGDFIRKHGFKYIYIYIGCVDDTQIHVNFSASDSSSELLAKKCMKACIARITGWLVIC